MPGLPSDLLDFLRELALNNDRDWFEARKGRYETSVRAPMERFAGDLIELMKPLFPTLNVQPKNTLFRIYRDVRFSKDKAPYKTSASLSIGPKAMHDPTSPGFHFHVDSHQMFFGSGYYMLEPDQIKAIRTQIADNLNEFEALLRDQTFANLFETFKGEKSKVLSSDLKAAATMQPVIFNKQFYFGKAYDAEEVLRADLAEFVMMHVRAAKPMNSFLQRALKRD